MQAVDPLVAQWNTDLGTYLDTMALCQRNQVETTAGLEIGSSADTAVKIANTTKYSASGIACSVASMETAFTGTTDTGPDGILGSATVIQEKIWYLCVNAAGTGSLVSNGITYTGSGNALLPERNTIADGLCVLGAVRIAVNNVNFTPGTTALNASGLTTTYYSYLGSGPTPLFGSVGVVPGTFNGLPQ